MDYDDLIFCPLLDQKISKCDCMENRYTKECTIPEKFKQKENWKDICKNCKYQEF